jgi:hypothetical protein
MDDAVPTGLGSLGLFVCYRYVVPTGLQLNGQLRELLVDFDQKLNGSRYRMMPSLRDLVLEISCLTDMSSLRDSRAT